MQQCVHMQFLKFAHVKRASTSEYLHACVKFKLSCTVVIASYCSILLKVIQMNVIKNLKEVAEEVTN